MFSLSFKSKFVLTFIVNCILIQIVAFSQQYAPKKFGKVSLKELQMTSYDKDTTAEAVILFDIGKFEGNYLEFNRHLRVKILKKSGLSWGNWVFNTPDRSFFKVLVFNHENGKIIKQKADNNSIYEEEVIDDFKIYKVFAPNVKVGSVIDIKYSFTGLPFEWRFQDRIPVIYSELSLSNSKYIDYSKTHFGFESIETVSPNKWVAKDMPSIKIEPFINDYSNYITKFEFQLKSIGGKGMSRFRWEYSSSWKKIIELLLETSRFGGIIDGATFLNDFAKFIKDKNLDTEQKINSAYSYIQKNLNWNGKKSLLATYDLRNNFKQSHSGNSAEINLCLIALLKKLDIETYPVVLSTRDNGLLIPYSPTLDKLNYVVAYVKHQDVEMLLDATSENLKPGILPLFCLNGKGLLVKEDVEEWIDLNNGFKEIKRQLVSITFNEDATAKASINQNHVDYKFLNWTEQRKASGDDDEIYSANLQEKYSNMEITDYHVTKKDKTKLTAGESIEIDISDKIVNLKNELIFNPVILFDYTENPFKSEKRKYPVDFACPKEFYSTVVVNIPEKFKVESVPESIKLANPDNSVSFTYLANSNNNGGLQFNIVLKLNKHIFTETEYLQLREFFSQVAKKVSEPVELIKS